MYRLWRIEILQLAWAIIRNKDYDASKTTKECGMFQLFG